MRVWIYLLSHLSTHPHSQNNFFLQVLWLKGLADRTQTSFQSLFPPLPHPHRLFSSCLGVSFSDVCCSFLYGLAFSVDMWDFWCVGFLVLLLFVCCFFFFVTSALHSSTEFPLLLQLPVMMCLLRLL